jgi:DeoR/GlpR family transcriptional regulator of sugar metabolism
MAHEPVFAEERRRRIAEVVAEQGRVRLADLVQDLGVTEPTIRKDLRALEQQQVLRRTHGGAIAITPHPVERTMYDRRLENREAKQRIAEACRKHIRPGESIFLDTGTTMEVLAERLGPLDITVVTNAVGAAQIIAAQPITRHILLGGHLRTIGRSLTGPIALDTLARFRVDIAFIGATGLTESGLFVADLGEAQIKQSAINQARQVIVALDQSKFGETDFVYVCGLDRVDVIITDRAGSEVAEWCAAHGTTLQETNPS